MPKNLDPREYRYAMEQILDLMAKQGKKLKDLSAFLNITPNMITRWKRNESASFVQYIDRIAEFLSVSPNDILGTEKKMKVENMITVKESRLLENYRQLSSKKQDSIAQLIQTIVSNE